MISAVKYLNDALSESQIILKGLADRCSPGDREYETTIEFALGNCNAKKVARISMASSIILSGNVAWAWHHNCNTICASSRNQL